MGKWVCIARYSNDSTEWICTYSLLKIPVNAWSMFPKGQLRLRCCHLMVCSSVSRVVIADQRKDQDPGVLSVRFLSLHFFISLCRGMLLANTCCDRFVIYLATWNYFPTFSSFHLYCLLLSVLSLMAAPHLPMAGVMYSALFGRKSIWRLYFAWMQTVHCPALNTSDVAAALSIPSAGVV